MSEKKAKQRIVSKGRYIHVLGIKMGLYGFSSIAIIIGLFGFALAVFEITLHSHFSWHDGGVVPVLKQSMFIFYIILLLVSVAIVLSSKLLVKRAKALEPVQPITGRNADLLTAEEVLLRCSDLPATEQQAELLRPTQSGQETPREELLRVVEIEGQE